MAGSELKISRILKLNEIKKEKEMFSVSYLVNSSAMPGFACFSEDNIQSGG